MNEPAQLRAPAAQAVPLANVIAVASGKGGVGKTWLSITLAQALAETGQRVLLFDGDLGLANVDVQLGLTPKRDLAELLSGVCGPEEAIQPCQPGGFDVLAGRSGSGSLSNLAPEKLADLADILGRMAGRYDRVVLDLGAGVERSVRFLAQQSGLCLVVVTDEPTSLTDAYAFIKLTLMRNPGTDLRVVVNQAGDEREAQRTYGTLAKACETFLKRRPELLGWLPRDAKVKASIRSQSPILTRYPAAPAAEAARRLAASLRRAPAPASRNKAG